MSGFPHDWQVQRLSELGFAYSGLSGKSKDDFGTGSKYVPYKNVFFNTFVDLNYVEQVNVLPNESQNKVQQGDVLLTISSETPEEVGMSAVVAGEVEGDLYLNSFCFGFRPTDGRLLPRYLGYAFRADYMRSKLVFLAQGSTRFNISKGRVLDIELPIPPTGEQQKIAAILTAVDDKLDVIARQISATQTLKQGLMQTLFTRGAGTQDAQGRWHPHTEFQDTELGRIPVGWSVEPLDALSNSITVGIATSTTEHYVEHGVPLIRNQNIKEDFLDMSDLLSISASFDESNKSKRVQGGDVLTVRTGYPGVSCVVPEGLGYLQTFTTLITKPKHERVNAYFVSLYFNSPQGKERMLHEAAGGAQQNINAGNLKKLLVPVPSLPEQKRIAEALESVSHKLHSLTTKQTHYQSLKRGLMQKLLTGEWRVRV